MTFHNGPQGPFHGLFASIESAIDAFFPRGFLDEVSRRSAQISGIALGGVAIVILLSLVSFSPNDPSWNTANNLAPSNWLGAFGALIADIGMQGFGFTSYLIPLFLAIWAWSSLFGQPVRRAWLRWIALPVALVLLAAVLSALPIVTDWSKPTSAGGAAGELLMANMQALLPLPKAIWAMIYVVAGGCLIAISLPLNAQDFRNLGDSMRGLADLGQETLYGRQAARHWHDDLSSDGASEPHLQNDKELYEYNDPDVIRQILAGSAGGDQYVPDAQRDDRVAEHVVQQAPQAPSTQKAPPHENSYAQPAATHEEATHGQDIEAEDAYDFEGTAYGATRYSLNFGNEVVNWSGLSSFAQATSNPSNPPNSSNPPGVLERSNLEHPGPQTKQPSEDVEQEDFELEPERTHLTNSFVERLRQEERRRVGSEPHADAAEQATADEMPWVMDADINNTALDQGIGQDESAVDAGADDGGDGEDEVMVFAAEPSAIVEEQDQFVEPPKVEPKPAPALVPASSPTLTETPNRQAVAPTQALGHAAAAVDQQIGGALSAHRDKQIRIQAKSREDRGPQYDSWKNPTVDFLDMPDDSHVVGLTEEQIAARIAQLENALDEFNVKGQVLRARPGPVVTLFEFQPAPGTRISRIVSLSDDIKRAMASASCRIAVVPETTLIGIELPNKQRTPVNLRQIIDSQDFAGSKAALPLAMGIDILGQPVIGDLARCPHLLIAGTTGAGKSVSLNGMIMSMLYKLPPDQLKMIMIDPKMLELSIYDKIPHLLSPVVTDPRKAIVALKWAVREMEERYATMMTLQVRGILDYNERIEKAIATGEVLTRQVQTGFNIETGKPEFEEQELPLKPMPYVVCIIDELADLMELAKKEIEGSLQRLTQMGRAAGIHVITATQRPSVDVITGVIKANIPSRVSLYVRSKTDSRIVLDEQGAEQLLRVGDMLYSAEGRRPSRVHSGFVSTEEVLAVVEHLKAQAEPEYIDAIQDDGADDGEGGGDMFGDYASDDGSGGGDADLYRQAVRIVCQDRRASTSYIQRKLQIGYNRAARLIEQMENEGIVGAADKVGRRDILVGGDE